MASVDWKAAIGCGQLVKIAYSVAPGGQYTDATKAAIRQAGYEFIEAIYGNELATDFDPHLGRTVTYGFLAKSVAGELVAAMRGTDTILEWIHDFAFLFEPDPIHAGGGMTEDGFTSIYDSLRVGAADRAPKPIEAIQAQVRAGGIEKIVVTGHSLGAALATLLGLDVGLNSGVKNREVYTFASPRVGELFFHHAYDSVMPKTYRVHNRPDVVPLLPLFPYEHVGTGLVLVPPFESLDWNFGCWHSLDTYLWLMDREAGGNTLAVDAGCRGGRYPGPLPPATPASGGQ